MMIFFCLSVCLSVRLFANARFTLKIYITWKLLWELKLTTAHVHHLILAYQSVFRQLIPLDQQKLFSSFLNSQKVYEPCKTLPRSLSFGDKSSNAAIQGKLSKFRWDILDSGKIPFSPPCPFWIYWCIFVLNLGKNIQPKARWIFDNNSS